jgi:protein SERAC1
MSGIYDCTYGILFFGTPHSGSSKARLLGSLLKIASFSIPMKILETDSALLGALEEDSEILQNITEQFSSLLPRFNVFFLWEQERTDLKYTKDCIVEMTSAAPTICGADRAGIAADHRGMCKFESKDSSGFRTVIAALIEVCSGGSRTHQDARSQALALRSVRRWNEANELVRTLSDDNPRDLTVSNRYLSTIEGRGATNNDFGGTEAQLEPSSYHQSR